MTQLDRVAKIMSYGGWFTLSEIALISMQMYQRIDSEAAVSARLREIRSRHHKLVDRRRRGGSGNLWEYCVKEPEQRELF